MNTNKYCCELCKKEYLKKSSLIKHAVLCNFKAQKDIEEVGDIPTYFQLVRIVHEMTLKQQQMEMKMERMEKFINQKRKKLNLATWLNAQPMSPTLIGLVEWVQTNIQVSSSQFEKLLETDKTMMDVLQDILDTTFYRVEEGEGEEKEPLLLFRPIWAATQKPGTFYVFDGKEWRTSNMGDMVTLFQSIQNKIMAELLIWKGTHQSQLNNNDQQSNVFNKALMKLMAFNFHEGTASYNQLKMRLYNQIKVELHQLEYSG